MASYDWFLSNLKKMTSRHPELIGKKIYIIDYDLNIIGVTVLNIEFGLIRYKYVLDRKPIYGTISYNSEEWFYKKEEAELHVKNLMSEYDTLVYDPRDSL